MGDIVPPSKYIKADFYKIRVGQKHLKLTTYETENFINLYIGGPKLYCIHATVNKPNSIYVQRGMCDKTIGTIEQIYCLSAVLSQCDDHNIPNCSQLRKK